MQLTNPNLSFVVLSAVPISTSIRTGIVVVAVERSVHDVPSMDELIRDSYNPPTLFSTNSSQTLLSLLYRLVCAVSIAKYAASQELLVSFPVAAWESSAKTMVVPL